MAAIEERASEDGNAAGEECLYRSDPGYRAVIASRDECGCVVRLENTESVQQAPSSWLADGFEERQRRCLPRVEEHEEACQHLQPRHGATVWYRRLRRNRSLGNCRFERRAI